MVGKTLLREPRTYKLVFKNTKSTVVAYLCAWAVGTWRMHSRVAVFSVKIAVRGLDCCGTSCIFDGTIYCIGKSKNNYLRGRMGKKRICTILFLIKFLWGSLCGIDDIIPILLCFTT